MLRRLILTRFTIRFVELKSQRTFKLHRQRNSIALSLILLSAILAQGCVRAARSDQMGDSSQESSAGYMWTKVTDHAAFPGAYNFPMFNLRNTLWVFHGQGNWFSQDGKSWTKAELPALGLRTGYQQYVQFNDTIYALGTMEGDYLNLKVGSRIMKTSNDLKHWELVAAQSELPARVFYGLAVFAGKMWMMGGFDGKNYYNDVLNSSDGAKWHHVTEKAPWSARGNPSVFVFNNRMWLLAGGIIDGAASNDVWSTADGISWKQETAKLGPGPVFGGSIVIYDGQIWIVGLNRNDGFQSAVMVSGDGVNWTESKAPWTPRGGVATCVFDGKLFMTGGKYSVTENGNIRFIYSNDVWYMTPSSG